MTTITGTLSVQPDNPLYTLNGARVELIENNRAKLLEAKGKGVVFSKGGLINLDVNGLAFVPDAAPATTQSPLRKCPHGDLIDDLEYTCAACATTQEQHTPTAVWYIDVRTKQVIRNPDPDGSIAEHIRNGDRGWSHYYLSEADALETLIGHLRQDEQHIQALLKQKVEQLDLLHERER